MFKIKALKPYKDVELDRIMTVGEEYEVSDERYAQLRVLEPNYLVGKHIEVVEEPINDEPVIADEPKEEPKKPVAKKSTKKSK